MKPNDEYSLPPDMMAKMPTIGGTLDMMGLDKAIPHIVLALEVKKGPCGCGNPDCHSKFRLDVASHFVASVTKEMLELDPSVASDPIVRQGMMCNQAHELLRSLYILISNVEKQIAAEVLPQNPQMQVRLITAARCDAAMYIVESGGGVLYNSTEGNKYGQGTGSPAGPDGSQGNPTNHPSPEQEDAGGGNAGANDQQRIDPTLN